MTNGPNAAAALMTRDEAIRRAGEHLAHGALTIAQMTPREQAEAAWTPTSRLGVDELEDLIRAERGYPPRGGDASEARRVDGT